MDFTTAMASTLNEDYNVSVTENGAVGYRTTGKALLDLNFSVASLRSTSEAEITSKFVKAFFDDKMAAMKWLFFARDVRGGLGERRLFRTVMKYLADNLPEYVRPVIELVAEYGRYDDLLCLLDTDLDSEVYPLIEEQLDRDLKSMKDGQQISLLAKWLPSPGASSATTKHHAKQIQKMLGTTERQYRKMLSELRGYLDVVEKKMSAKQWREIKYEAVPSRANLIYNKAFLRNDEERRRAYLESLAKGETKINAGTLFPHDIVHKYGNSGWNAITEYNETFEQLWKALPDTVNGNGNTIVVADGSGSMKCNVDPHSSVTALDVANALAIYFAEHSSGQFKDKYITFSIEADNPAAARARLSRIETDVLNNFKVLGVSAHPLSGYERLKVLHGVFHPAGEPFSFSYDWLTPTGLTTKDFIAPSSFKFGEGRYFAMGKKTGAVSFLEILAPELNDRILADMLDLETGVIVNLHIKSIDQSEAIKTIKRKITDLDKMKIEEQKKAVRSGYDMDIIPSDLATFGNEAKNLLQDLQSRNERMFLLTFLVVNMADTKRKLENDIFAAAGIAQKYNCALTRLDYQQEAGLMSSIPLGENLIPIQRGLTTSSTAIFIPFITQELFQTGAALYYGLNALSNNMILCDRKQLKNPNGLILGTPGSGKSFAAKREITNAFLITDDDIFICDPEAEYFALVKRLGGQVIRLSPTGKGMDGTPQYVNPMDMNLNYSEDDSPLALKSDFILSLCELVIGGKEGLQPVDKTVIDRAVRNVYRDYLADPVPEKMPILGDLYDELLKQPEPEAARIAAALELYVSGSLNVFNHRTNVELSNRLVCFDIKQLGKQLKKLGMLIVQDQVWNRVTVNRAEKKATRYYMDEFHLLLKEEQTAAYSVEIWKRFRKWGGIPTAITQNVKVRPDRALCKAV